VPGVNGRPAPASPGQLAAATWPALIIADAANDPQRRNKFVRNLIMTVISVVPGSVKRVSISPYQGGSDDHA
jgi:hypothetical protein